MKCKDCEYRKDYRRMNSIAIRYSCFCEHPNQEYIKEYFRKHNLQKMPAFISFGLGNSPDIKTAPRWCPLKEADLNG